MQTMAGSETYRSLIEQGLGVARSLKDTYVAGIEAAFDVWESQCRLILAGAQATRVTAPPTNPMAAWFDVWQRSLRIQTELMQRVFTGATEPAGTAPRVSESPGRRAA